MTPEELQSQLVLTGVQCRVKRDEVVVETCRFCANTKWNLELNPERGLFHCWACNAGGRLDALLTEWLGQPFHLPVHVEGQRRGQVAIAAAPDSLALAPAYSWQSAAAYLRRRGISEETARSYDLAVCTAPAHQLHGRLVFPVQDFWTGITIGFVGRTFTNQHPKYLSTVKSRMVVGYRMRSWTTPCVIVEGALDGIAVHRAGYHAAMLLGISAPAVRDFAARLPAETPLVVMLDGEAVDEARRLRWMLQPVRETPVYVAMLPKKLDPAELLPQVLAQVVTRVLN